jgi:hypothetical protein
MYLPDCLYRVPFLPVIHWSSWRDLGLPPVLAQRLGVSHWFSRRRLWLPIGSNEPGITVLTVLHVLVRRCDRFDANLHWAGA